MALTQQQHSALCAVDQWMAPFEVAAALYPHKVTIPQRKKIAQALRELHAAGLIDLNAAQNTYKRNERGRAALAGATVS